MPMASQKVRTVLFKCLFTVGVEHKLHFVCEKIHSIL